MLAFTRYCHCQYCVCMYVKIRRHQHTRVHAHTGPRRQYCVVYIAIAGGREQTLLRNSVGDDLAFTRYFFASRLYCESLSSFYPPLFLQRLSYCNTIARLLHYRRSPTDPPPVNVIHHTLLVMAILCKGQAMTGWGGVPKQRVGAQRIVLSIDSCTRAQKQNNVLYRPTQVGGGTDTRLVSCTKASK